MKSLVRAATLGAIAAALVACGGSAPRAAAPERPGLPAYWESQVTEESGTQAPVSDDHAPGTYFESWPDVNTAGPARTEDPPPWRVGPVTPPEGPESQRPQRILESDAPAGPP